MADAFSSSPSSTVTPTSNYDVFLSFRGEDTRENFTSHLFAALLRKKIKTFMDDDINKGDKISPELLNAKIEGSRISIIIFSENYASTSWCLDELAKILECKENIDQIVIPVFYHVHPSDVRMQTGDFGKAFGRIEKRFKKMADKLQKWRDALKEAAYLAGHESKKFRNEAILVDVIVKDVLKKLKDTTVSVDSNGLVGMKSRIEEVISLLCIGLQDFRMVGIWGMGGIGKTTLAEAIFNQIPNQFQSRCFMANVREESERHGLKHLRDRFLSEILEENIKIQTPNLSGYIKKRLQRMKVFIVLDDVNKLQQLEYLAGGLDRFGAGSRIIVTTRNKQVLEKCGVSYTYNVKGLSYHEALKHFCNHAFRENHPPEDLMVLLERLLDYASGNPLALKVLGSHFYGKTKKDWEKTMHDLKRKSSLDIYDVLKISYDELEWEVQQIFLDIACFFKGDEKDRMTSIFDNLYSINYGVDTLIDRSLITISNNGLKMHDLLQEMGWEIVRRESVTEPEKRSRLWYHKDILDVLNENKGTDSIKGIFLDLSKISDINLDSRAFANMSKLRLLKFCWAQHYSVLNMRRKVHLPQGLQYLSDELRYIYWHGYPLRMLPENFNPKNLIEFSLPYSEIEQLWKGKKKAPELKYIDLHDSQYFTGITDLLETTRLEKVDLGNYENLSCISPSIQKFNHLGSLSLSGCTSIKCFPSNIYFRSPITINLSGCVNLTEFPQIFGKIIELDLGDTNIQEVPSSIESLIDLKCLNLRYCKRLKILSASLCKLKSLCLLDLSGCSNLDSFPEILEKMEHLEHIDLKATGIKELPSSIENVQGLETLSLAFCSELHNLPQNLGNLKSLRRIHGLQLPISQLPSFIKDLNKVEELNFSGCRGLVLPDSLSGLSSLRELSLNDCGLTEISQDIGCLLSLKRLYLEGNNFESLPSSIKYLSKLLELSLSNCNMLQSLPELPPALRFLDSHNCKRLQSMPELPSLLQELDASVLELLTKERCSGDGFSTCFANFDFKNCTKLNENTNNNIVADSQRRIQHLALASVRHFCEEGNTGRRFPKSCGVSLRFPGIQIPQWFSHQNLGSSITILLPQFFCNRNFIGFALCAVIEFEQPVQDSLLFGLHCRYHFETKTFTETKYVDKGFYLQSHSKIDEDLIYESDHVFLGFDACLTDVSHQTAVSFDFNIDFAFDEDKEKVKVKRVGVCPAYAHPSETKANTFTVNMVPPTEEEYKKLHNKAGTSGSAIPTNSGISDEEEINATQQQSSFLSQLFGCWGLDYNCLWRIFQPCFEM